MIKKRKKRKYGEGKEKKKSTVKRERERERERERILCKQTTDVKLNYLYYIAILETIELFLNKLVLDCNS